MEQETMTKEQRLEKAKSLIREAQEGIRQTNPNEWGKLEEAWGFVDNELFKDSLDRRFA